ncbi:MAG: beta-propeller domain-containing protein [Labilithrix sp.]|nr:beta-propeller domain-containing protein [Labilithrix sp.]
MRSLSISVLTFLTLAISVDLTTGCSSESPSEGEIRAFASDDQLDSYLAQIEAENASSGGCGSQTSAASFESAGASPSASENAEITNNQEAGVDEGGIVKNVGSSLVVLRKGRLFVADVGEGRAPSLTDSMRVARTEGLNQGVWYDEMLVNGDLVYVIGYRYSSGQQGDQGVTGATEIDSFKLVNGKLTRLKSMYLESNDYYSGQDYASRMVGGKLVFYMPLYGRRKGSIRFPRVLEGFDDGSLRAVGPIFGGRDVSLPLTRPTSTTLHTVVQCDLGEAGELACRGRAIVGDWWRAKYVSNDAVFLWATSHVYRIDLASLDVTAHAAEGMPLDQFSFRQTADALLVASNPYYTNESKRAPALLRLPLAAFDRVGKQTAQATPLANEGIIYKNRFIGDVLVAAVHDGGRYYWQQSSNARTSLVAATAGGEVRRAEDGLVARIEPLGEGRALVAVQGESALTLRAIEVADPGRALGSIALDGIRQGESRSHGFFYKPGVQGSGTFGYAIVNDPSVGAFGGWGNGISNLGFFDVSGGGAIAARGIIESGSVSGSCETSCTDWYGNTRPVFLRDRTFALMGSELAEVSLEPTATKGATVTLDAR